MTSFLDAIDQLAEWREDGWRYSATTPATVLPETVNDIPFKQAESMTGFRTWLFRTQADAMEFRRRYGVVS